MRISLIEEPTERPCTECGGVDNVSTIKIFAGEGDAETEPVCHACRLGPKGSMNVTYDVDAVKTYSTAGPPDHRVKRTSRKSEEKIASAVGGRRQPGSGSMPGAKGDVRKRGHLRIEAKDTFSKQYTLTLAVLDKIRSECDRKEKPALVVSFREKHTHELRESWAVIPFECWEELLNAAKQHRGS